MASFGRTTSSTVRRSPSSGLTRRCALHARLVRPTWGTLQSPRRGIVVAAKPEKVTQEQLELALNGQRESPVIVDFFATWCGPCLLLAQELEKVADELGEGVKIYKIDVDENPALSSQLQIQGLPTMIFIGTDPAKPALRTEGLLPADTIKNILAKELA